MRLRALPADCEEWITLPDDATFDEIGNAVAFALVRAKESLDGRTEVEYVSGQRRDQWRKQ